MDTSFAIIIAGAGIVIGLLLGFMINALRGDSSKRSSSPPEGTTRGIDNILLWHDRKNGRLVVDLDGSTFSRSDQMRSDQLARLETCYGQLKRFLGGQDLTPEYTAPASVTQPPGRKPPIQTAQPEAISVEAPVIMDKKAIKQIIPEIIKPLSIVGEIDEILQDMISSTPLVERGLKLVETPAHTISVWIDKQRYENIEDVPEDDVKQLLHDAIKKWEDKTA
ncbi:MAG: hypothetical protein JW704_05825 [Anaerolineaceae bacterium]|nr:hypothetical protein [Anaerolineaceae bacterium]MBN2678143.1 hypothetical protein [Anaerolineaceae bacterium]